MPELLRTRCTQGQLIITDTAIIVELGNLRRETLLRSALVDIDSKRAVPSFFGLGGGTNLIFHGQGNKVLRASLVRPREAKRVYALLTGQS